MPMVAEVHSALRVCNYSNDEIADLWGEIVNGVTKEFAEHCNSKPDDIPAFARATLERNAN